MGKIGINDKDRKVLIILDACRYDYFKKVYKKYFKGHLIKKRSVARKTLEWLYKTFPDKYEDLVYVSGNPIINSKMTMFYKRNPINSREKFFKVVDTWDWAWSEEFGTVLPTPINSDFFKFYNKFSNKRFVLHYMQPHMPYVPLLKRDDLFDKKVRKEIVFLLFKLPWLKEFFYKAPKTFRKIVRRVRSKILRVKQFTNFDLILENYSLRELRGFYMENLEFVLNKVSTIVKNVDENIVITSDHGELLGEYGLFGHEINERYKELIEVPWLEIGK
jgi:hypothetical protein